MLHARARAWVRVRMHACVRACALQGGETHLEDRQLERGRPAPLQHRVHRHEDVLEVAVAPSGQQGKEGAKQRDRASMDGTRAIK